MDTVNQIVIEKAVPGQAAEIAALINSVYRGENSKKGWTTEAGFLSGIRITEDKIREYIESENIVILNAVLGERIIGCVHLEKFDGYSMLGMLSVDVNFQTFGIGRKLIEKSEEFVKDIFGTNEMRMKVISRRKELIDYYIRRGYSLTGETEKFITGPDVFGKPTDGELYFETLIKKL